MLRHGLIDLIVPRMKMRDTLLKVLEYLAPQGGVAEPEEGAPGVDAGEGAAAEHAEREEDPPSPEP
jgi:hypothetical protein